jgi:hypothetical protein
MKTKVLLLAGLLLLASVSTVLAKGKNRESSGLSELVKKEISYPGFARELKLTGVVDIFLIEGENGPELLTTGTEPKLLLYVEKRVSAIEDKLVEALIKENASHYRLTFRYVR